MIGVGDHVAVRRKDGSVRVARLAEPDARYLTQTQMDKGYVLVDTEHNRRARVKLGRAVWSGPELNQWRVGGLVASSATEASHLPWLRPTISAASKDVRTGGFILAASPIGSVAVAPGTRYMATYGKLPIYNRWSSDDMYVTNPNNKRVWLAWYLEYTGSDPTQHRAIAMRRPDTHYTHLIHYSEIGRLQSNKRISVPVRPDGEYRLVWLISDVDPKERQFPYFLKQSLADYAKSHGHFAYQPDTSIFFSKYKTLPLVGGSTVSTNHRHSPRSQRHGGKGKTEIIKDIVQPACHQTGDVGPCGKYGKDYVCYGIKPNMYCDLSKRAKQKLKSTSSYHNNGGGDCPWTRRSHRS